MYCNHALRLTQVLLAKLAQTREWRDKISGTGIAQDRPHLGWGGTSVSWFDA
jgi:hypothetical protein